MPRFFSISLITLALFVGAEGVFVPVAHAADCTVGTIGQACTTTGGGTGKCVQTEIGAACSVLGASESGNPTDGTKLPTVETEQQKQDAAYNGVMVKLMGLFAWLLGVSAILLDNVVYYTVVTMGDWVHNLSAVGVAWRILRDLANILLIFGFLGAGIATILNVEKYGFSSKMLPTLLAAAVLINFSLFISEAMIDGTNLFATEVYKQINGGNLAGAKNFDAYTFMNAKDDGIAGKIMGQLGLQTIYGDAIRNTAVFQGGNTWVIGFMGILLFITTAFVMFALSFILIARFVVLIFLILVSPVALMGWANPLLEYRMEQWWKHFTEQIATAPVLMLLLYVALTIITDAQFLTGFCVPSPDSPNTACVPNWTGFISGNFTGFASMILSFLVAIGFLLIVIIKAKAMSAAGAGWATKTAGTIVGGFTGRAVIGGASLLGRGTLGLIGRGLNSKGMQAAAAGGGVRGNLARFGAATGRNLENRTFDLRNVKALGVGGRAITGALGMNGLTGFESVGAGMGKGASVTAKTAVDKTQEAWKAGKIPFSGNWFRNQQKEYEKAAAELERKKNISNPKNAEFAKTLKKMSVDELTELRGIREGVKEFVQALSPAKYAELQKSDKLLKVEKEELGRKWAIQFNADNAATTIGSMNPEDVASLDSKILTSDSVMSALGSGEFETIRRKNALTREQRGKIFNYLSKSETKNKEFFAYLGDDKNRNTFWNVNNQQLP